MEGLTAPAACTILAAPVIGAATQGSCCCALWC